MIFQAKIQTEIFSIESPPSVSDVLGQLHAFHVHCVLVDIWNYMRDNVPSPVAFSATAAGSGKGGAKGGYRWVTSLHRVTIQLVQNLPLTFI